MADSDRFYITVMELSLAPTLMGTLTVAAADLDPEPPSPDSINRPPYQDCRNSFKIWRHVHEYDLVAKASGGSKAHVKCP